MPLQAGTKLGPYEITAAIGAGGMGEVYRARDSRLNRDVAIKVLPASYSSDQERLHRFQQEALAAAALNHPNILAVYDIGTQEGSPYIVSELLEGESLRDRLRSGALPIRKAIEYAVQVAEGLGAAHDKGIEQERLHRFQQEALAAAALNHPNILAVYDIGTQEGSPYIVSELLEGESLRDRLRSGALPIRKAIEYAVQVAEGLGAAHDKGIVHRDLKPDNIFVTHDGRVKLLDFGLAKLTQAAPAGDTETRTIHSDPGTLLGT